jgi:hypothetical protein
MKMGVRGTGLCSMRALVLEIFYLPFVLAEFDPDGVQFYITIKFGIDFKTY